MPELTNTSILESAEGNSRIDHTQYAADLAEIQESGKHRLYPLLRMQLELDADIELAEAKLKRLKAGHRHLTEVIIPEYAALDGVESLTGEELQAEGIPAKRWKSQWDVKCSITKKHECACHGFLASIMQCEKGEWVERYEIHSGTLKSQVKKFLAEPKKYLPKASDKVIQEHIEFVREAFGVYEVTQSKLTK